MHVPSPVKRWKPLDSSGALLLVIGAVTAGVGVTAYLASPVRRSSSVSTRNCRIGTTTPVLVNCTLNCAESAAT